MNRKEKTKNKTKLKMKSCKKKSTKTPLFVLLVIHLHCKPIQFYFTLLPTTNKSNYKKINKIKTNYNNYTRRFSTNRKEEKTKKQKCKND